MRAKSGSLYFLLITSTLNNVCLFFLTIFLLSFIITVNAQNSLGEQEIIRQQEREREVRQQMEATPSIHLTTSDSVVAKLPLEEKPCSLIKKIILQVYP